MEKHQQTEFPELKKKQEIEKWWFVYNRPKLSKLIITQTQNFPLLTESLEVFVTIKELSCNGKLILPRRH